MALGYTQANPLTYTPFVQTSFGYGSDELQNLPTTNGVTNPFQNATDYVKIVMTVSYQWGDTGHISTPENGDSVAVYDKETSTWTVEGERDHVNAILSELTFYPSRHQPTIDWTPTAIKPNRVNGDFTNESPHQSDPIAHTEMEMMIYSSAGLFRTEIVWIEAEDVVYSNSRPYFSSRDLVRDLAGANYDALDGDIITIGDVEDGGDDDNIEVKCEFLRVSDNGQYTGTAYGRFLGHDDLYVGDKKASTPNITDKRFSFTGNKHECQAFLDNVRYTSRHDNTVSPNQSSFIMKFTVTDGQIGSTYNMLCWNSDTQVSAVFTTPSLSYTEDTVASWNIGAISFDNLDEMAEAETFKAILTCNFGSPGSPSGAADFTTTTPGVTSTFTNDVLTITANSATDLNTALQNLEFTPQTDFDSNFIVYIKFQFESATYGTIYKSHYTSDGIELIISSTPVAELSNPNGTFNTTEGVPYFFNSSSYPQIHHPDASATFDLTIKFMDTQSNLSDSFGSFWSGYSGYTNTKTGTGTYVISGTKSYINAILEAGYIYYGSHNADNEDSYRVVFALDRTSGNQDFDPLETGTYTVNVTATQEFTMPSTNLYYREDNQRDLDFNVNIVDTAGLYAPNSSLYGSDYRMEITMLNHDNTAFTGGTLESTSTGGLAQYGGNGQSGTPLYLQGPASDVETALANIKFHPNVDINYGFKFSLTLKRVLGGNTTLDTQERTINGIPVDEFQDTSTTFDWTEDTTLENFDTGLEITDQADENSDYTQYQSEYKVTFRLKYYNNDVYSAYNFYGLVLDSLTSYNWNEGTGIFEMVGSKTAINANLANMRFTPQPNETVAFKAEYRIERLSDNEVFTNYTDFLSFNIGSSNPEFSHGGGVIQFQEDTYVGFDSQLRIVDLMTDNTDYSSAIQNSTYTVSARLVYNDTNGVSQNFTDAFLALDSTVTSGLTTLVNQSGNGQSTTPLTFEANKTEINNILQNAFIVYGNADVIGAPSTNGEFFVEFDVTRNYDSSQVDFPTFGSGIAKTMISQATAQNNVTVDPSHLSFMKNAWIEFDTGVEITDTADTINANYYQAEYKVEVRLWSVTHNEVVGSSANTAGNEIHMWVPGTTGVTGKGTSSITFQGTKSFCNTQLQQFRVASSPDTAETYAQLQFRVTRIKNALTTQIFDWTDTNQVRLYENTPQFVFETSRAYVEDTIVTTEGALDVDIKETILRPSFYYLVTGSNYQKNSYTIQYNGVDSDAPYQSFTNLDYRLTITYNNDNGDKTVEKIVSNHSATTSNSRQANNDWTVVLEGTKTELDTALTEIDMYPYRDYNSNITMDKTLVRLHDSYTAFNNTSTFFDGTNAARDEFITDWGDDLFADEDNEDRYVIEPYNVYRNTVDNRILDRAENTTDNVTYEITIESSPQSPTDHEFYFEEPYFAEDYASFEDYVLNTKVTYTGTKDECHTFTDNLRFTTLQHVTGTEDTDILYTQKRLVDGVYDVTHADQYNVKTVRMIPDTNVVDSTQRSPGPQRYWYNFDDTWEWKIATPTPDVKISHDWDRLYALVSGVSPSHYASVIDLYQENDVDPEYRAEFTSSDTLTYYGITRNETTLTNNSTAWMSKSALNSLLQDVTVYGASDNKTIVTTTIFRRTQTEPEVQLYTFDMPHWTIGRPPLDLYTDVTPQLDIALGLTDTVTFHAQNWRTQSWGNNDVTSVSQNDSQTINSPFNHFTVSPNPPTGVSIIGSSMADGASISNTLTNPVTYNFEYKPYNINLQQTYNMKYYGHAFNPITTVAGLNTETDLVFDHFVPKPSYGVQDIYHHAEILECSALNNEDLVIDVQAVGVTSQIATPGTTIDLKVTCKTYNDITQSGYTLQDSVTNNTALQITSSTTNLTVGEVRVSDIVKKSDGVYFTAWITNYTASSSSTPNYSSITKIGIFKVSYVSGNLTLTKVKDFETSVTNFSPSGTAKVMANLNDDIDVLTVITSHPNDTQTLQVYYKDEGGTDNWGLKASDSLSTTDDFVEFRESIYAPSGTANQDYTRHNNVCHSFFNGSDTVVTMSGRVYKKDQGGTDNWGYVKTITLPSETIGKYRSGFTNDYFFLMSYNSTDNKWEIDLYDDDLNVITTVYKDISFELETNSQPTEPNGLSFIIASIQSGHPVIHDIYFNKASNTIFLSEVALLHSYGTSNGYGFRYHSIKLAPK